jgi:hypothetical protein
MGRSLAWKPEECLILAQAYVAASDDRSVVEGSNQKGVVLWDKVVDQFKLKVLLGSDVVGRFHNRGAKAIRSRFMDTIQPDVLRFNK